MISRLLLVALGGACGAMARYGTTLLILAIWQRPLPLATWAANLLGCFLLGLLAPLLARTFPPGGWHYLLAVGFLGSYTTFSTFTVETLALWEQGEYALALLNSVGSVVLGLVCAGVGLYFGRTLLS